MSEGENDRAAIAALGSQVIDIRLRAEADPRRQLAEDYRTIRLAEPGAATDEERTALRVKLIQTADRLCFETLRRR